MPKFEGFACLLVLLAGVATSALPTPSEANDQITVEDDGKRKINLSGRQRMLSQYMAKAVCFVRLGIDVKSQTGDLLLAHHLFETTLNDLRSGSTVQEMLAESDSRILDALDVVNRHWLEYGQAVTAIDLDKVVALNPEVLRTTNEAVTLFQAKYSATGVAPEIAAAINIAGRQRMLTQKSSKEFCLIALSRDVEANRVSLVATVNLLEKSMRGLRDGDDSLGLKPAAVSELVDAIDIGERSWAPLREIFLRVGNGATPTAEEVNSISRLNVGVMNSMNNLVELLEIVSE